MTLLGMSEKKKRGIILPVMALAVCAVAMVGLGFALETTVTSGGNDVERLMIDLDSKAIDLRDQITPDDDPVDNLFDMEIVSNKDNSGTSYYLSSDYTFVKVYSNVNDKKADLEVKVSGTGNAGIATSSVTVTKIKISLYTVGDLTGVNQETGVNIQTSLTTVEVSLGTESYTEIKTGISCNTVYALKITEVTTSDGKKIGIASAATELPDIGKDLSLSLDFRAVGVSV